MQDNTLNNKRIAKNTLVLYIRTLFTMLVSLYTSRVVLNVLGVTDYGIYSAVGGVVAMFGIVSGALSSSISRFITFELGKNNKEKLSTIFSTSINILLILCFVILVVCEIAGVWFLNAKMNIPPERLTAANWVFQSAIISFLISIISIPYSASIIAHEHMTAYAYISIADALFKLVIVFLLPIIPIDYLISYSILVVIVATLIRIIYGIYCVKYFDECRYKPVLDRVLYKQMLGFTGWNFLSNGAMVFNTQGVTILVNLYFGVALNAARGIATHVETAVLSFVINFTTAINPQIIKTFATGELDQMFRLVCRGAKFTCFMLMMLALPLILEAETILKLWLVNVPDYTVMFVRLALVATMFNIVGNTGYTACQATGNIKWYSIIISSVGSLSFFFTWVLFELGFPVESMYYVFMTIYILVDIVRLFLMRHLIHFPIMIFFRDVVTPVLLVIILASIIPVAEVMLLESSILRMIITIVLCEICIGTVVYFIGMTSAERIFISNTIRNKLNNILSK